MCGDQTYISLKLPESVNGQPVVGQCADCKTIVFDGDKYGDSDSGQLVCESQRTLGQISGVTA